MSSFHWNKKNKPNKKKIKPFIKEIINHQELEEDEFGDQLQLKEEDDYTINEYFLYDDVSMQSIKGLLSSTTSLTSVIKIPASSFKCCCKKLR